jgi:hypothetical protein
MFTPDTLLSTFIFIAIGIDLLVALGILILVGCTYSVKFAGGCMVEYLKVKYGLKGIEGRIKVVFGAMKSFKDIIVGWAQIVSQGMLESVKQVVSIVMYPWRFRADRNRLIKVYNGAELTLSLSTSSVHPYTNSSFQCIYTPIILMMTKCPFWILMLILPHLQPLVLVLRQMDLPRTAYFLLLIILLHPILADVAVSTSERMVLFTLSWM